MNPQLGLFLISRLLMITSIAAFQTYGLFFLRDVVGLAEPAQALGRMILVIGGALAVAVYASGWVSDRVGRKPVVIAGAAGAALSTMWMLTAETSMGVLIIASVIGASVGTLLSANWALANELGSQRQAGLHMGIVNLATIGGSALAKLLGPGIDLLNKASENLGYQTLLIGCAGLFLAGAIILMPVKTGWLGNIEAEPRDPD
jgi:MFS family permease